MDNCPGQNKNRMVLRFCCLLLETKIYKAVEVVFLIAGHTKNVCDRLFSVMKRGYRNDKLYIYDHVVKALDKSEQVDCIPVTYKDFMILIFFVISYTTDLQQGQFISIIASDSTCQKEKSSCVQKHTILIQILRYK